MRIATIVACFCCAIVNCISGQVSLDTLNKELKHSSSVGTLEQVWEQQIHSKISTPELLSPSGDFFVPRFHRKAILFDTIQIGDTLRVSLQSFDGRPFKTCSLNTSTGVQLAVQSETPKCTFRHVVKTLTDNSFSLQCKAKLTFRRLIGQVSAVRIPPMQVDTNIIRYDTLLVQSQVPNSSNPTWDSIIETSLIKPQPPVSLQKETITHTANKRRKTTKQLVTDPIISPVRQLSPQGRYRVSARRWRRFKYGDHQKGDTVFVKIKAGGKRARPLIKVKAYDNFHSPKAARRYAINTAAFYDTIIIDRQKELHYHVKGKFGWRKQFIEVGVKARAPTTFDSMYQIKDTIFQKRRIPILDTLLYNILDAEDAVTNTWNIEQLPFASIPIKVPVNPVPSSSLQALFYWIGIGSQVKTKFQQVEEESMALWPTVDVSAALTAYGFKRLKTLPALIRPDLIFAFTNTYQKDRMAQRLSLGAKLFPSVDHKTDTYGRLNVGNCPSDASNCQFIHTRQQDEISDQLQYAFYLNFINSSSVTTYPLTIKIIGFYTLVSEWKETLELFKVANYTTPLP